MENPIYVKVSYDNTIFARREILSSEINLINSVKRIKEYKRLRDEELLQKTNLKKLFTNTKDNVRKIILTVPKTEGIKKAIKAKGKIEKKKASSMEDELRSIKDELRALA